MDTPLHTQGPTTLRTRKFALLLAVTACFGFSWSFYLILPKFLTVKLGLDPAHMGLVVSIAGLSAVVATPFVGTLVDRYGRRPWVICGSLIMATTGVGFLFVDRVGPLLIAMQVLWGIALMMTFNATGTLASDVAPAARMAQAMGLHGAANLSMNAISPAIGEWIVDERGWDWVFGLSILAALVAASLGFFLRDAPRDTTPTHTTGHGAFRWPLLRVYLATFAYSAGFSALFTLHQPFALELGVTHVREFFIGFATLALAVRLAGGGLIDRVGVGRASIFAIVVYATVPPLLAVIGPFDLLFIGALMGLAHGIAFPAVTTLGIQRVNPKAKGMVLSMVHGTFNGGHAVFSFSLGLLAREVDFPTAFWVAGAVTLCGAFILLQRRPKPA